MSKHHLLLVVSALVIVIGIFVFSGHLSDTPRTSTITTATTTSSLIRLVSLTHSYRRGKYTISGKVIVPTPCYVVTAQTTLASSTTPPTIKLSLSAPRDSGICLQLQATTTFSVTQRANKRVNIDTYLNGVLATTTTTQ